MRFAEKVVIVTGAGSGIGKATAQRFAAEGATVVAGDIDQARLDALIAEHYGAAYTASKHAVVGLTKNTAVMYGKQGIRCVGICPGAVNTGIPLGGDPSKLGYAVLQPGLGTIPRVGEAVVVANAILMVAADDASFINGAIVPVNGSWTAQG